MGVFLFFGSVCYGNVAAELPEEGLTLWQMIVNGGMIMAVLGLLSVISMSLIFFFFYILKTDYIAPKSMIDKILFNIKNGGLDSVKILLKKSEPNIIQKAVLAGIRAKENGVQNFRVRIEETASKYMEDLWQRINFLSDIAVVSPMLGLLGTVVGMIKAFNAIAFKISAVKPVYMAYGVSQAMITTAAGLIVGIFSMIFYFYFRAKLQSIASKVGDYLDEIADEIEKIS